MSLFHDKNVLLVFFLPKFSLCIIATARSNELVFDNNNQHTARALKEERQPQRARLGRR